MKRRLLCLFLAVILVLSLIPAPAVTAWEWTPSSRSGPAGYSEPSVSGSPLKPMVSADSPEEYLELCTGYPSYLTVRTDTECRLWTMPCDDMVCSASEALELTNDGDILTVTGLYRNTEDKYWYQVSREGAICYLYSPNVTVEEFLSFDIATEGLQVPGVIAAGGELSLDGIVTSGRNRICAAGAQVLGSDAVLAQSQLTLDTTRFDLETLSLDLSLLEPGSYELVLSVTARSHYSTDGVTLMQEDLVLEPLRTELRIAAAEDHICDLGTFLGTGEAHPHCSLYQCSVCGGTTTDWSQTGSRVTCELCMPGKPELKVLALLDGAVTCTWTDTPNTDYTEMILMGMDDTGSWVELETVSPAASGWSRILEPGDYRIRLSACMAAEEIHRTWADDVYFTIEFTEDDLVYDGVDISLWQEEPDWETLKENVDYVIVRCGFGSNKEKHDDDRWYANADGCIEHGIPFGVYLYSYALSDADAVSEAEHVLRLLEGYDPELPIYLDMEDPSIENNISTRQMRRNATIFCNMLEEAGYTVGIYANWAWWYYYMTETTYDRWSRWVAQYASKCTLEREFDQWQYTQTGTVSGIKTKVDRNYWYGALPGADHVHCYQAHELLEATCLSEGLEECICPCGEKYEQIIPASGCSYGDWTILQAPTLEYEGLRERTCLHCGDTVQQVMERLPLPFADVNAGDYYYEPVVWALLGGITTGVSADSFAPGDQCIRAQVVTFLWRAAGCPEPTLTEHPFTDVPADAFYSKAMLWAVENGITNGISGTAFGPSEVCNRAQVVTFLHRAAGMPAPTSSENPFTDVAEGQFYYEAMLWAVENGITNGYSADTFAPDNPCIRGQVVTFLHRFYAE